MIAAGAVTGAAGIGLTVIDYMRAQEREDIYRSLEDPEAILSWQEVELESLMVGIGAAFNVFDVFGVGKGVKAIVRGAHSGLRGDGSGRSRAR